MARGRKRMWAGWGFVVLGLAVAGVMVASRWWSYGRVGPNATYLLVERGTLWYHSYPNYAITPDRWVIGLERSDSPALDWWLSSPKTLDTIHLGFFRVRDRLIARAVGTAQPLPDTSWIEFVLWPFVLVTSIPGVAVVVMGRRVARRARLGHCPACNYNLRGLAAGAACPECGGESLA